MNDTLTPNSSSPDTSAVPGESPATEPAVLISTHLPTLSEPSPADADVGVSAEAGTTDAAPKKPGAGKSRRPQVKPADALPVLERLAALYPALFGKGFRPLKRGIYQELVAAHPDEFAPEALKGALGFHTRSTRYLGSVASGQMRHDLQGQAVEDMAPEHVHHALVEVWRRRQGRGDDALRARTVERMAQAFEASGMSREAWREHLQGRDESANAMLDEALTQAAAQAARDEALLRAFEASGQTVEGFAGDYGLNPSEAGVTLARARKRRDAPVVR